MNTSKSSESTLLTEAVQPSTDKIPVFRQWTPEELKKLEASKQEVKAGLEASNRLEAKRTERMRSRMQQQD